MKKFSERGSALVYTLFSVAILSMFTTMIYERVLGLMHGSRDWLWKERARAAAESGVAAAQAHLLANPIWTAGDAVNREVLKFTLDGSEVEVRTEKFRQPDVIWIFSTGGFRKEKKETVQPIMLIDPTLFALMAKKSARMGAGSIVTGALYGRRVKLEEGAEVVGSIISTGKSDMADEQAEAVVFDSTSSPPPVPELDVKTASAAWRQKFPSSASDLGPGHYIHGGDLTLKDVSETGVSICVTGDLVLDGNVKLESSEDTPVLFVGKNLTGTLKGGRIRGVIYVQGKVKLKGQGLITGTLIADEIDISDGVVVQSFDAVSNTGRPVARFWKRRVGRIRG